MKKITILLSAIFAFSFVSCDSESDLEDSNGLVIDAKWLVEDSDTYESFEFTSSGDYIVTLNASSMAQVSSSRVFFESGAVATRSNDSSIIVGSYTSDSANSVVLSGFGEVELVASSSESITFNLTLDGTSQATTLSSTVADVVSTSAKTDLLCRTWNFIGFVIDGEEYDIEGDEDGYGFPSSFLFTKSGTYLIAFEFDETVYVATQWKWKSEDDGTFYYTLTGEWNEDDFATVTTLTSSEMVVLEYLDGMATESVLEAAN